MIAKYLVHELQLQACASMQQCEPHFPRLVPRYVHFLCVSTKKCHELVTKSAQTSLIKFQNTHYLVTLPRTIFLNDTSNSGVHAYRISRVSHQLSLRFRLAARAPGFHVSSGGIYCFYA